MLRKVFLSYQPSLFIILLSGTAAFVYAEASFCVYLLYLSEVENKSNLKRWRFYAVLDKSNLKGGSKDENKDNL